MQEYFERSAMLLGREGIELLTTKRVAIFGIGGVGGYVAEALARTGVGAFDLIDHDTVSATNINRQIIATTKTIGRNKATLMKERILDINPGADVTVHDCFFLPENAHSFQFDTYDYVVDAVDTVTAKLAIISCAKQAGKPVISAMGAGNKLDPTRFEVTDISKTSVCPLAKVMRRELKKRGIEHVKVVYSKEEPAKHFFEPEDSDLQSGKKRALPGSVAFVPSVAGLILASEVVKDLQLSV